MTRNLSTFLTMRVIIDNVTIKILYCLYGRGDHNIINASNYISPNSCSVPYYFVT